MVQIETTGTLNVLGSEFAREYDKVGALLLVIGHTVF